MEKRSCPPQPEIPDTITISLNFYLRAMGEEMGAIARYREMADLSTHPKEKAILRHIMDEEIEHLEELMKTAQMKCAVDKLYFL